MLRQHTGIDVLTTQEAGRASREVPDDQQLAFAAQERRAIFTHNVKHYEPMAIKWAQEGKHHSGILMAPQWEASLLFDGFIELIRLYPDGLPEDLCMHLPRPPQR
jgi:hypothetical protein